MFGPPRDGGFGLGSGFDGAHLDRQRIIPATATEESGDDRLSLRKRQRRALQRVTAAKLLLQDRKGGAGRLPQTIGKTLIDLAAPARE